MRIERLQLDVILEALAASLEDLGQDARIQEEGRTDVEAIAAGRRDRAGAAADHVVLLEDRHRGAGRGQQQGGGKASGPGADDHDTRRAAH